MKTISGFTFIHNAVDSGYPIVEAIMAVRPYVDEVVVVDMQSTDNTRSILEQLADSEVSVMSLPCCCNDCEWSGYIIECDINKYSVIGAHKFSCPKCYAKIDIPKLADIRIIDGIWDCRAGETLKQAHGKHTECSGDIIIHFEADEVYDDKLIQRIIGHIHSGNTDLSVFRLQLEQNFQRCRWYPEPVHRVFPRMLHTWKEGHTTNRYNEAFVLEPKNGYLWDITNCFRDNWLNRVNKQAELRNESVLYTIMVPLHCLSLAERSLAEVGLQLKAKHWTYTNTPFNIPDILKPLVGMIKYEPRI